jgi:hypothetical protein
LHLLAGKGCRFLGSEKGILVFLGEGGNLGGTKSNLARIYVQYPNACRGPGPTKQTGISP